jgi:hypothetical protein
VHSSDVEVVEGEMEDDPEEKRRGSAESFKNAVITILKRQGNPMHARDLTRIAISEGTIFAEIYKFISFRTS